MSVCIPMIHINGTGAKELLAQQRGVLDACRALQHALADAAPHGRDYYPYGKDRINEAINDHAKRVAMVNKIREQAELIALGILEQGVKL